MAVMGLTFPKEKKSPTFSVMMAHRYRPVRSTSPRATNSRATQQVYDMLTDQRHDCAYCNKKERFDPRPGHAHHPARPPERSEHISSHWRHPGARPWRFECTSCVPCVPTPDTLARIHRSTPDTHGLPLPSLALHAPVLAPAPVLRCTAFAREDHNITKPYQPPSGVKIT